MQVEPPLVQIQTTTTLRPFKNSVCKKTLNYLMLKTLNYLMLNSLTKL